MNTENTNPILIEGYFKMLENLSPSNKLDLIFKLAESIKTDSTDRKSSFYKAFSAWESDKSADEIIVEIKESRTF